MFENDNWCFACGKDNPQGLHLVFEKTPDGVRTVFTPERHHQGFKEMLHGGFMMMLLDEAQAWAVATHYGEAVTAELHLRIRKLGPVGVPLTVIGRVGRKRMRLVESESQLIDSAGEVVAEATGKFMLSDLPSSPVRVL